MPQILTQSLLTRYAKYNALKNLLDKWLDAQRKKILEMIGAHQNPDTKSWEATNAAPDKGPYLLELGEAKARPNWKDEFRKHLIAIGYSELGADEVLQRILDADREKEPRLYCKVNPNYRRKFEIRLPA
jgi:hypothetical protein